MKKIRELDMKVLALDLGKQTGVALGSTERPIITHHLWDFSNPKSAAARIWMLHMCLNTLDTTHLDVIAYERPFGMQSIAMAESLHGYSTVVMLFAMTRGIHWIRIRPNEIKKHATGKGNAVKYEMMAAAKKKWPKESICDHNVCDALWVLDYVLHNEALEKDKGNDVTEEMVNDALRSILGANGKGSTSKFMCGESE